MTHALLHLHRAKIATVNKHNEHDGFIVLRKKLSWLQMLSMVLVLTKALGDPDQVTRIASDLNIVRRIHDYIIVYKKTVFHFEVYEFQFTSK